MNDGMAHLEESRHKQQKDVEREIDLARRCESGHLSFAQVPEDCPFEPESAFFGVDYRLEVRPEPGARVERVPECDLTAKEADDYWKDKIIGPWVEYEWPEMHV
ncbi:MAG: hypothetical protein V2A77_01395 [Pseudomonadota bacterium]